MPESKDKPRAVYNPGELDKTRKNIGTIEAEEARRMTKILGGEIGVEKAPLFDNPQIRPKTYLRRGANSGKPAESEQQTKNHRGTLYADSQTMRTANTDKTRTEAKNSAGNKSSDNARKKNQDSFSLPQISSKERTLMDKLMMSSDYKIKPSRSFIGYIIAAATGTSEKIRENFILSAAAGYIDRIQNFSVSVKQIISAADENYKTNISQNPQFDCKLVNYIYNMNIRHICDLYKQLEQNSSAITTASMIPFTKEFFRTFLPLYYTGEKYIPSLLKTVYASTAKNSALDQESLLKFTRDAAANWIFIYGQAIKGLYPLLMRMCSSNFQPYPDFLKTKAAQILEFLEMTKFDLFIPTRDHPEETAKKETAAEQPKNSEAKNPQEQTQTETAEEEASAKKTEAEQKTENDKEENTVSLVDKGLSLLDNMFPNAGWKNIKTLPDMYPYFQPIYNFSDGFNLLSPENPLQITIILLRIIEDFFQGCRHIRFSIDKEQAFASQKDDLSAIFAEWSLYREVVFDKTYASELKDYVNHVYMQSDFPSSIYAKKIMSNLLWQSKYSFLPHLSFEMIFMEKPNRDDTYKPLSNRVAYLKKIFSELIARTENFLKNTENSNTETPDFGAVNILEHYRFDVPNSISRRADILLGGKKSKKLTNLNLLKYCLCVISVLDWWINDPESPAYDHNSKYPYRTDTDNNLVFAVSTLKDPNKIFIQHIKQKIQTLHEKKQTEPV